MASYRVLIEFDNKRCYRKEFRFITRTCWIRSTAPSKRRLPMCISEKGSRRRLNFTVGMLIVESHLLFHKVYLTSNMIYRRKRKVTCLILLKPRLAPVLAIHYQSQHSLRLPWLRPSRATQLHAVITDAIKHQSSCLSQLPLLVPFSSSFVVVI